MFIETKRWRAPSDSGEILVDPPATEFCNVIRGNRTNNAAHEFALGGETIQGVRAEARHELIALSRQYSDSDQEQWTEPTSNCDGIGSPQSEPAAKTAGTLPQIIISGHQPELFHPGVWFKNFLLSHAGQQTNCVAVNLVVDNDLCRHASINVLQGNVKNPKVRPIPYDLAGQVLPYEVRRVADKRVLSSFGRQVAKAIQPFVAQPIIEPLWENVLGIAEGTDLLGEVMARSRHQYERTLGLRTLELPLSRVSETRGFKLFVAEILSRAREFLAVHNQVLADYRNQRRLRSKSRPVPDLNTVDEFCETPFWIWQNRRPQRRPLYARIHGDRIELTDFAEVRLDCRLAKLVDILSDSARSFVIRPRALTTTLYARLVLCDLFLHGIGGAIYDEVTDGIIQQFWRVIPPLFAVATATYRLPIEFERASLADVQEVRWRLRELRYHGEKFVDHANESATSWAKRKQVLLETPPPKGNRRSWHYQIQQVNQQIEGALQPLTRAWTDQLARTSELQRRTQMFDNREYSFCLFPLELTEQLRSAFRV
ncbi:MAG TPA: hypothetical protein PKD64_02875 [Pirellulaceae bacterium]|nr:hypothetical protein [Pirellulaceae bacterium]HMP70541.1 hypothetical protein [Pirellulaceae bacterium]